MKDTAEPFGPVNYGYTHWQAVGDGWQVEVSKGAEGQLIPVNPKPRKEAIMPTQTVWIDPELLLEHQGVRVFHTYKDDDYDQGAKRYWFTLNLQCGVADSLCEDQPCRHVFDVLELSTWRPPEKPPYCTGANDTPENRKAWEQYWELEAAAICAAITTAIEQGELSASGWRQSQAT